MNGNYDDATNQVARLMQAVGGSVDAYEDTRRAPPASPKKPSWEQAIRNMTTKPAAAAGPKSPIFPDRGEEIDASSGPFDFEAGEEIPSNTEVIDFVQECLAGLANPSPFTPATEVLFPIYAPAPPNSDPKRPPTPVVIAAKEEHECGGEIDGIRGASPAEPIMAAYELVGQVENLGELSVLYYAFTERSLGEADVLVKLESGTYPVTRHKNGNLELKDTGKKLHYLLEDVAHIFPKSVEPEDVFIWVLPITNTPMPEAHGYLHNGWAFMHKGAK